MRKDIEDSTPKTYLVAIAAPRSLFAANFLADQRRYLEQIDSQR